MNSSVNVPDMILAICKHVNYLQLEERQHIYKLIVENSEIPDDKIIEKGTGIEIKFKHLSEHIIRVIYNYVESKINKSKEELEKASLENMQQ